VEYLLLNTTYIALKSDKKPALLQSFGTILWETC